MFSGSSGTADLASAAALFKNPVPTHGPKRNTACHQCRKRKLKCDTKRPCGTCVRSHTYALSHATEGADVPEEPDCTYGDEKEPSAPPSNSGSNTNNKVEKLESRISELEGLLREMQLALDASQQRTTLNGTSGVQTPQPTVESPIIVASQPIAGPSTYQTPQQDPSQTAWLDSLLMQSADLNMFDGMDLSQFSYLAGSDSTVASSTTIQASLAPSTESALVPMSMSSSSDKRAQLTLMGWPQHLPEPEVTRHLVHAFFAFHMHAGRLFHGPTFLASLDLHPTDPRFPFAGILHAMCAVGSLYTADIPRPPNQPRTYSSTGGVFFTVDELFPGRWRQLQNRTDSFAEQQARFARLVSEASMDRGEFLIECLQTQVILTWLFYCQARWSESYIASSQTLRCAIPCGMNIAAPFHNSDASWLFQPDIPPSILPEASTVIEHETRRNIFWIAYALERQQAAGNSFAMVLDDLDVCQLLPLRGDQFEQGIHVPIDDRQWSHDKKMFLTHPPNQTDSFILFIKVTILLSHVKNFNLRFRGRYFAGDAAMYSPSASPSAEPNRFDPRDTQAFQELDHIVTSFRPSFPSHLRNPTQDDVVDPYLFAACSGAHLAQLLLHEPHARLTNPNDLSRNRVLKAGRAVLDLAYGLSATSYDVSLLDHLPILSWNVCGRVLVRCLKAAIDRSEFEQMMVLQAEIGYMHGMLAKAGERMPVAYRYKKMVFDYLASVCGRQYTEGIPEDTHRKRRFPSPQTTQYDTATYVNNLYSPATYPTDSASQMQLPVPQPNSQLTHSLR